MVRGQQDADAPRIANHRRPDLEQMDADRCRRGLGQFRRGQGQFPQALHQRISQG